MNWLSRYRFIEFWFGLYIVCEVYDSEPLREVSGCIMREPTSQKLPKYIKSKHPASDQITADGQ